MVGGKFDKVMSCCFRAVSWFDYELFYRILYGSAGIAYRLSELHAITIREDVISNNPSAAINTRYIGDPQ